MDEVSRRKPQVPHSVKSRRHCPVNKMAAAVKSKQIKNTSDPIGFEPGSPVAAHRATTALSQHIASGGTRIVVVVVPCNIATWGIGQESSFEGLMCPRHKIYKTMNWNVKV